MSREHFHHQPGAGSGGAAISGSSDATAPAASFSADGTTGSQTSGPATVTDLTSGLSSSTPFADPTATSSLTPTTSESQPTSTSQSDSNVPGTGSDTQTSSPAPSQTESTTNWSSSFVSPPSTTQPSILPSSQLGTPATTTSAYTTYVNGSQINTQTVIPSVTPQLSSSSFGNRSAIIIAASAVGGTIFVVVLILSFVFCARRKRFEILKFLDAIPLRRKPVHSGVTALDDEDLDEVGLTRPLSGYTNYVAPWDTRSSRDLDERVLMVGRRRSGMSLPTRPSRESKINPASKGGSSRPSYTGTRPLNPLTVRSNLDLDLGHIVDDVMGPSTTAMHRSHQSVSSVYRVSEAEEEGRGHSRSMSGTSNAGLLEGVWWGRKSEVGSTSTRPMPSDPLAKKETKSEPVEHQGGDAS